MRSTFKLMDFYLITTKSTFVKETPNSQKWQEENNFYKDAGPNFVAPLSCNSCYIQYRKIIYKSNHCYETKTNDIAIFKGLVLAKLLKTNNNKLN